MSTAIYKKNMPPLDKVGFDPDWQHRKQRMYARPLLFCGALFDNHISVIGFQIEVDNYDPAIYLKLTLADGTNAHFPIKFNNN